MTPEQQAYVRRNTVKPANVRSWMVFTMTHPDFTSDINLVAITDPMGVEFDDNFYTFEGVTYKPVSMSVSLPRESKDSNGQMSIRFARAGSEAKRRMNEITPSGSRIPITFEFKQYQEGVTLPVRRYSGTVAKDYPKVGGNDVEIAAEIYNPNLLTSQLISTLDLYPELRAS